VSAIAELVGFLLSTGIPPESVERVVNLAQQHAVETAEFHRNSTGIPPENAESKRRVWDRERKRKIAESKKNGSIIDSLSKKDSIKEESKKESLSISRSRKARPIPLPEGWQVPQSAIDLARERGVDIRDIEGRFRDYLKSSGKQYVDYDAAICNFVRGARPTVPPQNQTAALFDIRRHLG
jgi:hypothetical protein